MYKAFIGQIKMLLNKINWPTSVNRKKVIYLKGN